MVNGEGEREGKVERDGKGEGKRKEEGEEEKACVCKLQIDWKIALDRILPWIEKEIEKNGENEPINTSVLSVLDNFGIPQRFRKNMNLKWFGIQFQRKLTENGFVVQIDHNKEIITILKKPEDDKLFDKYEKEIDDGMPHSYKVNAHLYNRKFGELASQVKKELEKNKGGKIVVYMEEIRRLLGKQSEIVRDYNILTHMRRVLKERGISVGKMKKYDDRGNDTGDIKLFTFRLKGECVATWKKRGFSSKGEYDEFKEKYEDFDDKDFVNHL